MILLSSKAGSGSSSRSEACSRQCLFGDYVVTSNAPIDFEHLSKYTLNDRALEAEILDLFVEQLPQSLMRLQEARSLTEWRSAAHTIKGSARAVGAAQLADAAAAAEAMPLTADCRSDLIERVVREIERAISFVGHAQVAEH